MPFAAQSIIRRGARTNFRAHLDLLCLLLQYLHCFFRLFDRESKDAFLVRISVRLPTRVSSGISYLEYTCFLPCDVLQGLSQHGDVVNSQRCDSGHDRLWDDVRAIVSSTHAYLKDSGIDLVYVEMASDVMMWMRRFTYLEL